MTFKSFVPVVLCAAFAVGGCRSTTPDEHAQKAAAYVAQEKYAEAIVEYRVAVQLDPRRGDIRTQLADAYMKVNDANNALREYVRAADLMPTEMSAQLKAGNLLLFARAFEDAKARADRALAIDPHSVDAQILRGNALAGLTKFDEAAADYEGAIAQDASRNEAFLSLGAVQAAKGQRDEAEATFKKAVDAAPTNLTARLALANYYWKAERPEEALKTLEAALALNPDDPTANRAFGAFYLASGQEAKAEPYFKKLAEISNTLEGKLALADYYIRAKNNTEARRLLGEMTTRPMVDPSADVRLATLDASEGRRPEAAARIKEVLEQFPKDTAAQLLSANLMMMDGKREDALKVVSLAVAGDPNSVAARSLLARIYVSADRVQDAIREYEQVLTIDRRPVAALTELAKLQQRLGATDKSVEYAQQALALGADNPDLQDLMVRNHLVKREIDKAKTLLAKIQQGYPTAVSTLKLTALVQVADNRLPEARATYTRVLQTNPKDLEALNAVVVLDLQAGQSADAKARLDAALQGSASADLLLTAGRLYALAGDLGKSEETLRRAVTGDPGRAQGYSLLAQLYQQQNRLDEAVTQVKALIERDPKSISARTMLATLMLKQGQTAEAEKAYEQVLSIDPRAAVAANNLAWLYVAGNKNLDQALQLAQVAREALPDDPDASDTLGWIYVRKNLASLGIPHLEASVAKATDNPLFQYHLGMVYMQTGDSDRAREALNKALAANPNFDGAADARKALADLGV